MVQVVVGSSTIFIVHEGVVGSSTFFAEELNPQEVIQRHGRPIELSEADVEQFTVYVK